MKWNDGLDKKVVALVGDRTPAELMASALLISKPELALDVPLTPTALIMPDVGDSPAGQSFTRNTLLALGAMLCVLLVGTAAIVRRKHERSNARAMERTV